MLLLPLVFSILQWVCYLDVVAAVFAVAVLSCSCCCFRCCCHAFVLAFYCACCCRCGSFSGAGVFWLPWLLFPVAVFVVTVLSCCCCCCWCCCCHAFVLAVGHGFLVLLWQFCCYLWLCSILAAAAVVPVVDASAVAVVADMLELLLLMRSCKQQQCEMFSVLAPCIKTANGQGIVNCQSQL